MDLKFVLLQLLCDPVHGGESTVRTFYNGAMVHLVPPHPSSHLLLLEATVHIFVVEILLFVKSLQKMSGILKL